MLHHNCMRRGIREYYCYNWQTTAGSSMRVLLLERCNAQMCSLYIAECTGFTFKKGAADMQLAISLKGGAADKQLSAGLPLRSPLTKNSHSWLMPKFFSRSALPKNQPTPCHPCCMCLGCVIIHSINISIFGSHFASFFVSSLPK